MKQEKRKKQNRKRKNQHKGDVFSLIIFLAAVCSFIFSAYQLTMALVPYYTGGKEYDKIKNLAIISNPVEGGGGEVSKFQVDFDKLLQENPDTIAWIRFEEPSVISYPVVKSQDNQEYLTKTFSLNDNKLGAIFMDMRNQTNFNDRNTLIYGHNMKVGGEMFSQLSEYADEKFYQEHPYFYIYTPDGKTRTYEVFTASVVKDNAPNYNLTYNTDEEFESYLELCKSSSNYQTGVEVNRDSKIVSLSTCTNINDDERFMLQGVLIKEE